MTSTGTRRATSFLALMSAGFLHLLLLVLLGHVILFQRSAPAPELNAPNFQIVKIASPPLPVPPPPIELPIPPVSGQPGGGLETSFPPPAITLSAKVTFTLPKMPSIDEFLAKLPESNFGSGSDTGSGDGNSSSTGDGTDFGAGLSRDAVVHLDLNTWWSEDQHQLDCSLNTEEDKQRMQQFGAAVRLRLKQRFTHITEYDSTINVGTFTMVRHPNMDQLNTGARQYRTEPEYGFNPKIHYYGFSHDIIAMAYAAIGALTQPDILVDADKFYAPYGIAHGMPAGQPEVLVIASPGYGEFESEADQDLIDELKKRRIKLILLTQWYGPPASLVEYARESGGSYSQLVLNGDDDTTGELKPGAERLPYQKKTSGSESFLQSTAQN